MINNTFGEVARTSKDELQLQVNELEKGNFDKV